MKKFLMCAAALLMAVTAVSAQTPEEKEASAKRVEQLKSEAPKACGVAEIDDAAKTAETVAAATVEVADFTALLDGATPSAEQILRGDFAAAAEGLVIFDVEGGHLRLGHAAVLKHRTDLLPRDGQRLYQEPLSGR